MAIRPYSEQDLRAILSQVTSPSNPLAARQAARGMANQVRTPGSLQDSANQFFAGQSRARLDGYGDMMGLDDESRKAAASMTRTGTFSGSNTQLAWPKERDPFQYWADKSKWYTPDAQSPEQRENLIGWARLLYSTHHLVPSLIDIYSRFPLLDIEFTHKDPKIASFFEDLFMGELDYHEHLFDMGREYWIAGEAFSLGSWHDGIGAWEADDLINPNDVEVSGNSALRTHMFHIKVPEGIKKLLETRDPPEEYDALLNLFPDVVAWARQDKAIPVSDALMYHSKFKTDPWNPRGTPILLRAFRQLMLEQSLLAAQDAVADRLYSPLILAKVGLDNVDSEGPWLPDPADLIGLRNDLNMALLSDFRLFVYHHGLDIKNVFGRESVPRLDNDFDRVDKQIMGVFGIGEELLRGGKSNTAYAAGALNRELITQILQTYQISVQRFLRGRMEAVASRQGFYEYDKVGEEHIPIMERVLVYDEETGEEYVEDRPKLAIPEVSFRAMNLRDEKVERQFLQELKRDGWPISDRTMALNIDIDFDSEMDAVETEKIEKVMREQQFKAKLFRRLITHDPPLPIPPEYKQEFEAWLTQTTTDEPGDIGGEGSEAFSDISSPAPTPNLAPSEEETDGDSDGTADDAEKGGDDRPAESDSMRENAPRAARLAAIRAEEESAEVGSILDPKVAAKVDEAISQHNPDPDYRPFYGRMKYSTPSGMTKRVRMKLPENMTVLSADEAALLAPELDLEDEPEE